MNKNIRGHANWALIIALLWTAFYFIHESLPRPVRSITSLLLAPVAIASGLSRLLPLGEVYGSFWKVFLIHLACATVLLLLYKKWIARPK